MVRSGEPGLLAERSMRRWCSKVLGGIWMRVIFRRQPNPFYYVNCTCSCSYHLQIDPPLLQPQPRQLSTLQSSSKLLSRREGAQSAPANSSTSKPREGAWTIFSVCSRHQIFFSHHSTRSLDADARSGSVLMRLHQHLR
jgi:hypothetical protein